MLRIDFFQFLKIKMTEEDQVEQVENEPEEIEEIVPNSVPILKMVKGIISKVKNPEVKLN